ncbi:uncharacterized protein LOC132744600 [Ruditapes philippinarum]|uniref:uncharacterized protein LOC132744600 n=1 Tax=Ruditapes philippinarum TaxID=129788 RepID=UPI00295B8F41|nr:uncharacterized protein LOC132744600 [Ruditapes philippinarum]
MSKGKIRFVFSVLIVIVTMGISSASLTKSNGTAAEDINGKMLLKLGRTLGKPIITLLGMAIRNLEHFRSPCYDWTQWSRCGAIRGGYIATRRRTRKCGRYKSRDKLTTETDIGICEGFCPNDYNVTANGFCVKLYDEVTTFDLAEKQCQADGGHVINIESELKYGDVKKLMQGFQRFVYIDGRRKDTSSKWLTVNGSQKEFFKWAPGEPDNVPCIKMSYYTSYWHDCECSCGEAFICEI